MPRFFTSPENIGDGQLTLLGDTARHIARSLRMAVGDTVTVSDGVGRAYECRLAYIRDDRCECEIIAPVARTTEPRAEITLLMAYPKGDKLETVIQKAVELGASRIQPFLSAYCVKRPGADRAAERLTRLNRIACEAAGQCGRARLPRVEPTVSFERAIALAAEAELPLFCYEGAGTRPIGALLPPTCPASISVTVGSEGGFSEREAEQAMAAGLRMTGLGPRILRCETAPCYALSALSCRYEAEDAI